MSVADRLITLNVGGTLFTTLFSTLTSPREPNSLFRKMFIDHAERLDPGVKDKDGNVFLDRNPRCFEVVLEWMRTGEVEENVGLPVTSEVDLATQSVTYKKIQSEASYFGLDGLVKEIDTLVKTGGVQFQQTTYLCFEPGHPRGSLYEMQAMVERNKGDVSLEVLRQLILSRAVMPVEVPSKRLGDLIANSRMVGMIDKTEGITGGLKLIFFEKV
ncbi:BTB/POZ domain-containing protein kctd9 [Gonapodya sp. JEL0774]|nr:BTB/POZ domain-containing protein kctd9 [Gonapodya sp. JEL0774]